MSSKKAKGKTTKKRPQRATSNVFAMFDQSQIQEFKEAFNMIDQNRDGFIDKEDLHDMLASLGKDKVVFQKQKGLIFCPLNDPVSIPVDITFPHSFHFNAIWCHQKILYTAIWDFSYNYLLFSGCYYPDQLLSSVGICRLKWVWEKVFIIGCESCMSGCGVGVIFCCSNSPFCMPITPTCSYPGLITFAMDTKI